MDNLNREQRCRNMQHIRSTGTLPERMIARELRKRKIYFSQYSKSLIGKPDFVFRSKKTVVFIDSDFWHGHKTRLIMPKTNLSYWRQKIQRNKKRDKIVNSALRKEGWKIIRIWEHDIKHSFNRSIARVLKALDSIN